MSLFASTTLLPTKPRLSPSHLNSAFRPSLHPRILNFRFYASRWAIKPRRLPLTPVVSASVRTPAEQVEDEIAFSSSSAPSPIAEEAIAGMRKIPFSDVVVLREREVYWGRKWSSLDITTGLAMLSMHVLSLFAPFTFTWPAFLTAVSLCYITGLLGLNLSYHRHLSHRSFKLPKWLEYTFAYFGVQALQGHPINWVSTHRYHHQRCDTEGDPHSPTEGFWFSHMNWIFDNDLFLDRCGGSSNASEMEKQGFYRFVRDTYVVHPIALGSLLYAVGGFPFLVWGMGVRIVWVCHMTWLINSACHVWGNRPWNTKDLSRNNWLVALLAFGEGWHNNHHAFEFSARHGLEWWQIDTTWYVIRLLEALGLATDVKLPTEAQLERMKFKSST